MEENLQEYVDGFLEKGGSVKELLKELVGRGYLLSGVSDEEKLFGITKLTESPDLALIRATAIFKNGTLIYDKKENIINLELREDYEGKCNLELDQGYVNVFDDKGLEPVASIKVNCGNLHFPIKLPEWEKPLHLVYH